MVAAQASSSCGMHPILRSSRVSPCPRLVSNSTSLRPLTPKCRFQSKKSNPAGSSGRVKTWATTYETPPAVPQLDTDNATDDTTALFDWTDHWYPVVYEYDVADGQLYPFTLLGVPIVIWRDPTASGAFRAFRDACPHRLVPLSEGRLAQSGYLECPYHGWQFSGDGTCQVIPQGGDPSNPRSCATAYQCVAKQGLVWVRLRPFVEISTEIEARIPIIPELDDPQWFELQPMWRDLPMDFATLIENVVDAGHVPFTHHASVSKRQTSSTLEDLRVVKKGPWGFEGFWQTGPRKGALGPQATLFKAPALMRHTIEALDTRGFANITAVYAVPSSPGRCRLIVRQPFRFKNGILRLVFGLMPAFMGHLGNLSVLDDDNIFLHLQERESVERGLTKKPIGQVYWMPGASDAYVATFRRWLESVGKGGPFGPQDANWLAAAGPRLTTPQLLEHYHSHTERCNICRTALKRIKIAQMVSGASAAVGAVVAIAAAMTALTIGRFGVVVPAVGQTVGPLVLGGLAVAVVMGAVWVWCSKTLPRFYQGEWPPPRNRVPGEWAP